VPVVQVRYNNNIPREHKTFLWKLRDELIELVVRYLQDEEPESLLTETDVAVHFTEAGVFDRMTHDLDVLILAQRTPSLAANIQERTDRVAMGLMSTMLSFKGLNEDGSPSQEDGPKRQLKFCVSCLLGDAGFAHTDVSLPIKVAR
jgi:hypothetical protein